MPVPERITWLRPTALPGAELLCASNTDSRFSSYHERYAVCQGLGPASAIWRYRGQSMTFGARRLGLVEPGELHATTFVFGPRQFNVLYVAPELFMEAAEAQGLRGQVHFRLAQCEDLQLSAAIQGLTAAVTAPGIPLEQQTWLTLCLHRMQAYAERSAPAQAGRGNGAAIRLAMDCLRQRYQDPVDLDELSDLTGLSRFGLVHAFTHQVGLPPHAFQLQVRIERARALLGLGVPPAEVAAEVGFADQSHFNRHFKRVLHTTPGRYARAGEAPALAVGADQLMTRG